MFAVASSITNILAFFRIALAIQINYRSPIDKLSPISFISIFRMSHFTEGSLMFSSASIWIFSMFWLCSYSGFS